jgi:hypothetical protein
MQGIADNNSTHKQPQVQAWFYPVIHHHSVAAANARLTGVERWLRGLADTRMTAQKGSHCRHNSQRDECVPSVFLT